MEFILICYKTSAIEKLISNVFFWSLFLIQFGHGQSNPTFLLEVHSGSSKKRYVMRKKPPGKLLESAHAVEREFQVLYSLSMSHRQIIILIT